MLVGQTAKVLPLSSPVPELDDAELVRRLQDGDEHAWEKLYRRHAPSLLALATRLVGTKAEGDDAVHDGFMVAFDRISQLRTPSRFRPWIRQVVVNECRSRLRRRRRWIVFRRGESPEELFDSMASRSANPEHACELQRIGEVVSTLSADDRIAWSLRFIEGCTLEEGAALAGCSLATFKRRLSRAARRVGAVVLEGVS